MEARWVLGLGTRIVRSNGVIKSMWNDGGKVVNPPSFSF